MRLWCCAGAGTDAPKTSEIGRISAVGTLKFPCRSGHHRQRAQDRRCCQRGTDSALRTASPHSAFFRVQLSLFFQGGRFRWNAVQEPNAALNFDEFPWFTDDEIAASILQEVACLQAVAVQVE